MSTNIEYPSQVWMLLLTPSKLKCEGPFRSTEPLGTMMQQHVETNYRLQIELQTNEFKKNE